MALKLSIGKKREPTPLVETLEDEAPAPAPAPKPALKVIQGDMAVSDPENRFDFPINPEVRAHLEGLGFKDKRLWVAGSLYDRELQRKDAKIRDQDDPFPGEPILFAASVIRMQERFKFVSTEPYKAQADFRKWVIARHQLTGIK